MNVLYSIYNIIVNTQYHGIVTECWKTDNTFVNTTIPDAHAFNIIVIPTDIDNIIIRVRPAIQTKTKKMKCSSETNLT